MKMVVVAGPPSTGKTSVVVAALKNMDPTLKVGVVKFDCLVSGDESVYEEAGAIARTGLSAGQCPDHYFASNAPRTVEWGKGMGLDLLITESAGLCNRCSPYIEGVPAVCVCDCMAGMAAPRKMGPLLKAADLVVLTKSDMVSQSEREVLAYRVQTLAPRARVVFVNGLTGQGSLQVARFFQNAAEVNSIDGSALRFSIPSALCSYCLGERLLGEEYQMGNVRRLEL